MAYELIETVEVGAGGASSIEFTSIPQDGVDLVLLISARKVGTSGDNVGLRFNADSGSNYNYVRLYGTGSSVNSTSANSNRVIVGTSDDAGDTANTFSNQEAYISNYTSSSAKSISATSVKEDNSSTSFQDIIAGQWTGSSAITSITAVFFSENFDEGSTISLYKIS